jgi:hypothetical protein
MGTGPLRLFTFRELGHTGLGPSRGQFEVAEVHAEGLDKSRCLYRAADGVLHADDGRIRGTDLADERWEAARGRLTVQFLTAALTNLPPCRAPGQQSLDNSWPAVRC